MEKNNALINKLKKFINDKKTLENVLKVCESEFDTAIVKYFIPFKNYFFSKTKYNNDKNIVKYSDSILDVIGYTSEQIEELPNNLNSIIHEDDRLRVEIGLKKFFDNPEKTNFSISYRVIKNDDTLVYIHETLNVIRNRKGKVIESASVFFNISEIEKGKKKIEEFSNQMINVNKIKDKFISIVSHDLKSPYTTLLGFSEILMNDSSLPENEKDEYLSYIYNSSKHQLNYIEHLLDWSRLRTGRTVIEEQRLNLKNIISSVVSKFTGIAVRKNIEISQNIQSDIFVNSDEKQLGKAVSALLKNAINFSHRESTIFIYGNRFKNGMVEIIVKDKGIGIPENEQEKIFKLDQKHSREGTEGEQGSGMGLILVREIMNKLHGDVWFYSKEDEGSEFHLTVPEAKNIVLLVDNNYENLKKRSKLISEVFPNYILLKGVNAFTALEYINDELPSIMIIKEDLPLMNAKEFLKKVRNKDKYFSVSVIILANKVTDEIKNEYSSLVVDGIFPYDIENEKLIKIIKTHLK